MSIIAIPIQLLTSALIGRVSPEAAGTLGVIELFYNAVITFFLFGGETAVIKLLSDIETEIEKKSFVLYYIIICIVFFVLTIAIFRLLRIDLIKNIISSSNDTSGLMYLIGIIIVVHNVLLAYQKEQNKFVLYSFGYRLFNFIALFATIIIFLDRAKNYEYTFYILMGFGYSMFIIYVLKDFRFKISGIKSMLSKNNQIWGFAIFLHASTIVAFLFDRVDQIVLLNKFGITTLGGYFLIVKLSNMVKLIPNIYNSTFYLLLCKELRKDNASFFYTDLLNRNMLVIVPLSIILILNSELIIKILFGSGYLEFISVLRLFMIVIVIGAPGTILNNYLFALGKSRQFFWISSIAVTTQIILLIPLLSILGVNGLVISRGIASIIVIILCTVLLKKLGFQIIFPRRYFMYSISAIILMILSSSLVLSYLERIMFSIFLLLMFTIINRRKIHELLVK